MAIYVLTWLFELLLVVGYLKIFLSYAKINDEFKYFTMRL